MGMLHGRHHQQQQRESALDPAHPPPPGPGPPPPPPRFYGDKIPNGVGGDVIGEGEANDPKWFKNELDRAPRSLRKNSQISKNDPWTTPVTSYV